MIHKLIERNDPQIPDLSYMYGSTWHAPLTAIKPGMAVKIAIEGDRVCEWPWATVKRVNGERIWVDVGPLMHTVAHGIESGAELEIEYKHIHCIEDLRVRLADMERVIQRMDDICMTAQQLEGEIDRYIALDKSTTPEELAKLLRPLHLALEEVRRRAKPSDSPKSPSSMLQ